MLDSTLPTLRIVPNPTSGEISITSSGDLGAVNVAVYDMLGAKQNESIATMQKNSPTKIMLPAANGMYNVRVRSGERTFDLRVVVSR
jgi:hypothetical protein